MKITKEMTKADIVLVVVLIILSIAGLIGIFVLGMQTTAEMYISVQVDGVEAQEIPVDASTEGKTYAIRTEYGENIIQINDQKVSIVKADCPDQLCVHQGEIDRVGPMLVCLPNHLLVELKAYDVQVDVDGSEIDGFVR